MLFGFLLILLVVACYSCIDINHTKNGSKGLTVHFMDKNVYLGVANLSDDSYKSLSVNGVLTADNIKVKEAAKIMGEATIVDSKFVDLDIMGRAKLTNLQVSERLKVMGKANLTGGTYGQIILHGQKFNLTGVTASSIIIKNDDNVGTKEPKKCQLNLVNSKINGDLICKSGNCDLLMDQDTQVSGKITGFNGF